MGDLLIRGLDPETKERLAARAKANRRSISAEAADILSLAINLPDMSERAPDRSAADTFRELREKYGPVEFELPPREMSDRPPPDFE
ncbi:hypothetical protein KL771_17635 [Hyphomicrobiaceae bacterium 22]|uniref:Antitoxin FitA-like ribbon-helix-helix domain-containing protein n=2 Tax=Prosthecodimorpha staleyi TaxID=2840188 RepID=A0A947D6L3_9HYPH|nr:hypothetical protein [Prosthecodimorpha staleyi]MBT9291293.1 hypothetical protein [Prosthecodimorpha staleyi]